MTGVHRGAAQFAAHVADGGERALVCLIGELDLVAVPQATQAIEQAAQRRPRTLELDLSSLAFMDSTGLRLMLTTRQRALEADCRLLLRRGPDAVQRVFEITALDRLFEFVD